MLCRPSPYLPVPPHQDFTCLSSSSCHWASLTPSSLELAPSLSGQHWTPSWPAPTACVAPPPPHCSVPWRWRSASCPAHSSPPPAGPPCQQQGLVDSPGGGRGYLAVAQHTRSSGQRFSLCAAQEDCTYAVFSVQFAVCSLQRAVYSVQTQRIVCSLQRAVCSVQCAVCSVQCAVCSLKCAVCSGRREV